jgi:hypothetical protein
MMQHATSMAQQDAFRGAVPENLESYGHVDFDQATPAQHRSIAHAAFSPTLTPIHT